MLFKLDSKIVYPVLIHNKKAVPKFTNGFLNALVLDQKNL